MEVPVAAKAKNDMTFDEGLLGFSAGGFPVKSLRAKVGEKGGHGGKGDAGDSGGDDGGKEDDGKDSGGEQPE